MHPIDFFKLAEECVDRFSLVVFIRCSGGLGFRGNVLHAVKLRSRADLADDLDKYPSEKFYALWP
jgi:hypothetical protein